MDWFKQNPFLGGLAVITLVLVAATSYFLWGALGQYDAASVAFGEHKAALEQLQAMTPFPNAANVSLGTKELEEAKQVLDAIAKSVQITVPDVTPISFADELRKVVNDLKAAAEAAHVTLEENFYLGFNAYENQLPSEAAAPKLALQLQSIQKVISILIDERVEKITAIVREPLAVESAAGAKAGNSAVPDFILAPFNISFIAEQAPFHQVFNRIIEVKPPVFVRLVSVVNSAPTAPSKVSEAAPAAGPAGQGADDTANKPIFGREVLHVNLGLASITSGASLPAKP